ncbi:hypothetical protein CRM22_005926 [Opisthorchis felineus]|uniref:Uncharacterized protein n=1 Tax=Opisthorchis felineus TaxID=147828 RepID=A0A4S2LNK4_OPIFE|nr:hypothetical protein CRM22_005926 [Opisthorchis felineus]
MDLNVLLFVKLIIAWIVVCIALGVPEWACGQIFTCKYERGVHMVTGVFITMGLVALTVVLVFDSVAIAGVQMVSNNRTVYLVRSIFLIAGTSVMILGLVIYVVKFPPLWSYLLAVCGTMFASELCMLTICECVGVRSKPQVSSV